MKFQIPANTQAIIFDLGGVILNIDYQKTVEAFKGLGLHDFNYFFSKQVQKDFFDEYEKGFISSFEFLERIKSFLPESVSNEQIVEAWNAMLLDLPEERLHLLKKLRDKYSIFLLSNTNEIHINEFHLFLKGKFAMPDLTDYFNKVYLSYQIGKRKPDAEIFEHVLLENNLLPKHVVFIDDSPQHIEGAKSLGITTFHLENPTTILDIEY
ncbi:MAG: HAD family phosphatase [Bacteroidetes bacterium]|nr:HAD family phosphatase [Bacteroidota bacterium]